jgi:hypothetical protein
MPLPAPVGRRLVHRRVIVCEGFARADGLTEVDARVLDTRTAPVTLQSGVLPPGKALHAMAVRLTVDDTLTLKDVHAVTDAAPFRICGAIAPDFSALAGKSLARGFGKTVRDMFAGIKGCVHIVDLLGPAATTAYQTMSRRWRKMGDQTRKPAIIGTCHAWASDSEVVKREFPRFYTGE